jgi:hypothetical protein
MNWQNILLRGQRSKGVKEDLSGVAFLFLSFSIYRILYRAEQTRKRARNIYPGASNSRLTSDASRFLHSLRHFVSHRAKEKKS